MAKDEKVEGTVKFYDPDKEFGFIETKEHGDIHVSGWKLKNCATLEDGENVEFFIKEGRRGKTAVGVVSLGVKAEEAIRDEVSLISDKIKRQTQSSSSVADLQAVYEDVILKISENRTNNYSGSYKKYRILDDKLSDRKREIEKKLADKEGELWSRLLGRYATILEPYVSAAPAQVGGVETMWRFFKHIRQSSYSKFIRVSGVDKYSHLEGYKRFDELQEAVKFRFQRTQLEWAPQRYQELVDKLKSTGASSKSVLDSLKGFRRGYPNRRGRGNRLSFAFDKDGIFQGYMDDWDTNFAVAEAKYNELEEMLIKEVVAENNAIRDGIQDRYDAPELSGSLNKMEKQITLYYELEKEFEDTFGRLISYLQPSPLNTQKKTELEALIKIKADGIRNRAGDRVLKMAKTLNIYSDDYTELIENKEWLSRADKLARDGEWYSKHYFTLEKKNPEWWVELDKLRDTQDKAITKLGNELKKKKHAEYTEMLKGLGIPLGLIQQIAKDGFIGFTTPEAALYNLFRYTSKKGIDLQKIMGDAEVKGFMKKMIKQAADTKERQLLNEVRKFLMEHNLHLDEEEMNRYLMKHFDSSVCVSWTQEHYKPSLGKFIHKYFRVLDSKKFPGVSAEWEALRIKYAK